MVPDVVIFDLDDTLISQESTNREIIKEILGGLVEDPQSIKSAFFQKARSLWASLESYALCRNLGISSGEGLWGEFTSPGQGMVLLRSEALEYRLRVWKEFLEEHNLDSSKAPFFRDEFIRLRRERNYWLPGALELLNKLKGRFSLFLLTNGAADLQWFKIQISDLEKYFSQIVVSGDVGIGKPDAQIFYHLMEKHPKGTRFLMVGNSLSSDIRGAQNAGVPSVWLDREGEALPSDLKPWKTIRELMELPALLGV